MQKSLDILFWRFTPLSPVPSYDFDYSKLSLLRSPRTAVQQPPLDITLRNWLFPSIIFSCFHNEGWKDKNKEMEGITSSCKLFSTFSYILILLRYPPNIRPISKSHLELVHKPAKAAVFAHFLNRYAEKTNMLESFSIVSGLYMQHQILNWWQKMGVMNLTECLVLPPQEDLASH